MNSDVLTPARPVRPVRPDAPRQVPDGRRPARPGRRPRPGSPAQRPKSPVRPASPVRPPGPGRSGRPAGSSAVGSRVVGQNGRSVRTRRTSFVLLLLGLLGGSLVCLLVVNTTLDANSITISNLQKTNTAASERVQQLEQQVASASSAATIAKEARRLGMRPDPELMFINLRTRKIEEPRGAAAIALALRLAAGWPASPPAGTRVHGGARSHSRTSKPTAGRSGR